MRRIRRFDREEKVIAMEVFDSRPWQVFAVVAAVFGALLAAVFALHMSRPAAIASHVRVQNDTGVPLQNVRINGIAYGDLAIAALSQYQRQSPAYRYAKVELRILGKNVHLLPDDYVGERPLGPGRFTYRLQMGTAKEGLIDLHALKDAD